VRRLAQGKRHSKDRGIGLEDGAVVTICGYPSAARVDGRHGTAETDRGALPAACGCEILDQRAIALRDPPLLTESPAHPLVAECECAGTARVGRVVALDHPRDRPPQLAVSAIGKMRLQEFGNS
jgi:hypothetical protein